MVETMLMKMVLFMVVFLHRSYSRSALEAVGPTPREPFPLPFRHAVELR